MVFSKIRGITLSDFSSAASGNRESSESEEEDIEESEEGTDVITDNLGDIGR